MNDNSSKGSPGCACPPSRIPATPGGVSLLSQQFLGIAAQHRGLQHTGKELQCDPSRSRGAQVRAAESPSGDGAEGLREAECPTEQGNQPELELPSLSGPGRDLLREIRDAVSWEQPGPSLSSRVFLGLIVVSDSEIPESWSGLGWEGP